MKFIINNSFGQSYLVNEFSVLICASCYNCDDIIRYMHCTCCKLSLCNACISRCISIPMPYPKRLLCTPCRDELFA